MKPTPFFSIIIPTLNEEKYLPILLSDLKDQTYANFEVVVVDGKSDDKTVKKSQKFDKHFPLKIITSQKRNVCFQRNLGVEHAKSDWIIFMDADIRVQPFFLQGIKYRADQYESDMFVTYLKPDSSHQLDIVLMAVTNMQINSQKSSNKPAFMESMFVIKKEIFKKIGGFDESVKWGEGGVFVTKAAKKGYKFSVYKDPEYTFSLRRLRSQGTLKIIRSVSKLFIAQQFNTKLSDKKISQLYPMQGGDFFDKKPPKTTLEKILKDITELSPKQFMNKFFLANKSPLIKKFQKRLKLPTPINDRFGS